MPWSTGILEGAILRHQHSMSGTSIQTSFGRIVMSHGMGSCPSSAEEIEEPRDQKYDAAEACQVDTVGSDEYLPNLSALSALNLVVGEPRVTQARDANENRTHPSSHIDPYSECDDDKRKEPRDNPRRKTCVHIE